MRLELGLLESVSERAAALIDRIIAGLTEYTPDCAEFSALKKHVAAVAELRALCLAVHALTPILPVFGAIEELLETMGKGQVPATEANLAVARKCLAVSRQAVLSLAAPAGPPATLPKVLAGLEKVVRSMLTKNGVAAGTSASESSIVERYRQVFLRDESATVHRVRDLCARALEHGACDVDELFRLVHTIKGNAMAVGFEQIAQIAAALEDRLAAHRESGFAKLELEHWYERAQALCEALRQEQQRAESEASSRTLPQSHVPEAYLTVEVGGNRFLIPDDALLGVVMLNGIQRIPVERKGWLGLARIQGQLVPVLDPACLRGCERQLLTRPSWAILLESQGNQGRLCLPVDEVLQWVPREKLGAVIETQKEPDIRVLDLGAAVEAALEVAA